MALMGVGGVIKSNRNVVEITVHITNSGSTGAASVSIYYTCDVLTNNPSDPFDAFKWDDKKAIRQPLGPKQTIELAPCAELTPVNIKDNAMGIVPRYIIGEARYESGRRWTQFAQLLRFFGEDVTNLQGRAVAVGRHNCTEEQNDCHE